MTCDIKASRIDALNRTIDWLEAHPDNAITGHMATNKYGHSVRPHDPEATCFCMLGRLCVEAGIRPLDNSLTDAMREWLEPLAARPRDLYHINDGTEDFHERIDALRSYVNMEIIV